MGLACGFHLVILFGNTGTYIIRVLAYPNCPSLPLRVGLSERSDLSERSSGFVSQLILV